MKKKELGIKELQVAIKKETNWRKQKTMVNELAKKCGFKRITWYI